MSSHPVGILLAAGASQRFGSNKLLHPLHDNTPMLLRAAQNLINALPDSMVVINSGLTGYTAQLADLGMRVIVNEQAQRGIGSSIACGVQASPDASGWLIAPADMPYLKPETIGLLAQRLSDGAGIVAPLYNQQRGHPVGFNRRFRDELLALNEDIGARDIIARHRKSLQQVSTDDAGVVSDVDQISDLRSG